MDSKKVVLVTGRTKYSPGYIVGENRHEVKVEYYAGQKKNEQTGLMEDTWKTDTVKKRHIVSMTERR